MKTEKPYGAWESSYFSAEAVTQSIVSISELSSYGKSIYWLESRPNEGRCVIVRYRDDKTEDAIPKDKNARTRVHEYGGGSWLALDEVSVLYSNFSDQRIYINEKAITIEPPTIASWRYADGCVNADKTFYYCVYERHKDDTVKNAVARIDLETGASSIVAEGADFFSCPRLNADGNKLAYLTWDHPNMPWDATKCVLLDLETGNKSVIAQGDMAIGRTSILQLHWSKNELYFLSDVEGGWYGLYLWDGKESRTLSLTPGVDLGDAAPGWKFGQRCYDSDGCVLYFARPDIHRADTSELIRLTKDSEQTIDSHELPLSISNVRLGPKSSETVSSVLFLGASPEDSSWVGLISIDESTGKALSVIRLNSPSASAPNKDTISIPQRIAFQTTDQATAYAYYYPPTSDLFCGPSDELPPLLVKAHGGPTACAQPLYSPKIQFWTSRGIAVVDVDYRGSTGYGADYRHALRGKWGIYDVDDVCAAAKYLADNGFVDPKRLAISGGSAGGYTVLGALAWKSVFKAGCCQYGIGDLRILARETHKFESRYMDRLVGGVLPQDEALYRARAPVEAIEQLDCPVLFLHGEQDAIVPPSQAFLMHSALKAKGVPTALKLYANEQHGFREAVNIVDALNSELFFFSRVFKFDLPSPFKRFCIENLPPDTAP